jgi:hypothetical protein
MIPRIGIIARAMLYADDSDEEMETAPQEDLEAVPESGSKFGTEGEQLNDFTLV